MDHERVTTFGAHLRRLRLAAGLSQEALAELAGLTANGIGALERGDRRYPYPNTTRALVDALGLDEPERAALLAAAQRPPGCAANRSSGTSARLAYEQACDATCASGGHGRLAVAMVPPPGPEETGTALAGRPRAARRLRRRHGMRPARILRRCCSCSASTITAAGATRD